MKRQKHLLVKNLCNLDETNRQVARGEGNEKSILPRVGNIAKYNQVDIIT